MTLVVAWLEEELKSIVMGADSLGVTPGFHCKIRQDAKVFHVDDAIIGGTTSFRMLQILRYHLHLPPHPEGMDTHEYMVRYFVEECRRLFKEHGYSTVNNNTESAGEFLVGYQARIFHIESDFQVAEEAQCYAACGCGFAYALGALEATINDRIEPFTRVEEALRIGEKFSSGVSGPFTILSKSW